jgi:dihydrolipoamide dehydrogenase
VADNRFDLVVLGGGSGGYAAALRYAARRHPTQSEAIGEAHLLLAGKPLHVHG